MQRLEESNSEGEGNGKTDSAKRSGWPKGNRKEKHRNVREPATSGRSRSRSPKGLDSSSNQLARNTSKDKSFVRRVQPSLETVRELAVVSLLPTPSLPSKGIEGNPLNATAWHIKSRVESVQKGGEKRDTSKLSKQGDSVVDLGPTPLLEFAYYQTPAMLLPVGPRTPPGTARPALVSHRGPLSHLHKTRMPPPNTLTIIGQR